MGWHFCKKILHPIGVTLSQVNNIFYFSGIDIISKICYYYAKITIWRVTTMEKTNLVNELKAAGITSLPDIPKGTKTLLYSDTGSGKKIYLQRGALYNMGEIVLHCDGVNGMAFTVRSGMTNIDILNRMLNQ